MTVDLNVGNNLLVKSLKTLKLPDFCWFVLMVAGKMAASMHFYLFLVIFMHD